MEIIELKKGELLASKNNPVKEWYIIQEGSVVQKNDFVENELGVNAIIGILEQDFFICDYIAKTDCKLILFVCRGVDDLKHFLHQEAKMRTLFLHTAVNQRYQQFRIYDRLFRLSKQFTTYLDTSFEKYQSIVINNRCETVKVPDISTFQPLNVTHVLEKWEIESLASLMKNCMPEYMKIYTTDDNLTVGAIMETSAQMHRAMQGIMQMIEFFVVNRDLLISDKNRDLYHGMLSLLSFLRKEKKDTSELEKLIEDTLKFAQSTTVYSKSLLKSCAGEYNDIKNAVIETEEVVQDGASSDFEIILDYAGFIGDKKAELIEHFATYSKCYTNIQKDKDANALRKQVNNEFYEIYKKCFLRAVNDRNVSATVEMFLNFGYVDGAFLEEDKINGIFSITTHMDQIKSDHVFTIFNWLKAIYRGDRDPSRNEFDLDFRQYLVEEYKSGNIKKEDIDKMFAKPEERVSFEIDNMFQTVNRLTYGSISSFNAILNDNDMFNDPTAMLVTKNRLFKAINQIRSIDYSAFYRPVYHNDMPDALKNEPLMHEVLPDIILMPNAGSRGMMWQETASIKNDTPARFMLPMFATCDISDTLIELTARFRWEICRKIQGARWNDIREHSLTSDYYDYLQFYRKNHDLSNDAKDQIKTALQKAKNTYREVFVKDYFNWINYESKGGFRLNKVARTIVFTYCPFSKEIRSKLEESPMFSDTIHKFNVNNAKQHKRLSSIYDKYTREGGVITPDLKENIDYYDL